MQIRLTAAVLHQLALPVLAQPITYQQTHSKRANLSTYAFDYMQQK